MTPERTLDRRRRPKSVADRLGRPERGWRLGLRRSGKPPLAGGKDLAHEPWRIPPLGRGAYDEPRLLFTKREFSRLGESPPHAQG